MAKDYQRLHGRIPFSAQVRLQGSPPVDATGIDLSAGGAALHTRTTFPPGSVVEVDLFGDGTVTTGTVRNVIPHDRGGYRLCIQWQVEEPGLPAKWQRMAR